ncbi:MAG: histidinol dehydrogenase [Alphaproteobacteria bacterium]|nr:histidinol dehydrogenase [Alphaproteobacteria bacterium]
MPLRLDATDPQFEPAFDAIVSDRREAPEDVRAAVADILGDVRERGDAALIELTERFDRFALTRASMRVGKDEIDDAWGQCERRLLSALEHAAARIEAYHRRQMPEDMEFQDADENVLGYRWTPLDAVGLYVPGGKAAYPSSVLMTAVPARIAGVTRLAMVVPAPGGDLPPLVLAAAKIAGVEEIYRIGGAQAIAALAYGTETVAPVDKIVGPGNIYVTTAKAQLYGLVGIDSMAGPSEILIVADGANDAKWIAADLLAQAEHDAAAQSVLITDNADFADAVEVEIAAILETLPRADTAGASWRDHGAVIVVGDLGEAAPLVDRMAPEHLELACDDEIAETLVQTIRHAGAIFVGRHSPEAMGDYVAGPSHVLPTSRTARFSSGLSVFDFLKRSSIIRYSAEGLAKSGPSAVALAEAEGLDAHALSVTLRLKKD